MQRLTHEQYLKRLTMTNALFASGAFSLESEYERATIKIKCRCNRCGEPFERRPDHLANGQGCPHCDGTGRGPGDLTHERFLKRLAQKNEKYARNEFEVVGQYAGSTSPLKCRCPEHGSWTTTPTSLLKGTACPTCANRLTHEEFMARLLESNEKYARGDIRIVGKCKGSKEPIEAWCNICDEGWTTTPNELLNGRGCPQYRKHPGWKDRKTMSVDEFMRRMAEEHPDIEPLTPYENMTRTLRCRCKVCGHEWDSNGTKLLTLGQGCGEWRKHLGYVSPKKMGHDEFERKLREKNSHYASGEFELVGRYDGADNKVECRCNGCGEPWSRTAFDLVNKDAGCPYCSAKERGLARRKGHGEFLEKLAERNEYFANGMFEVVGEYKGSKDEIACHCHKCGNEWEATPDVLYAGSGCPKCMRSGTSRVEQMLLVLLERALGEEAVVGRDMQAIGMELDIYIPDRKLAIEYGSWFWHEGRFENDIAKMEKCRDERIRLITVYDQCPEAPEVGGEVKSFPFDLWNEGGQASLRELARELLEAAGCPGDITEDEWKSARLEAVGRTGLRSTEEFLEELAMANEAYTAGRFEVVGEYTGNHTPIACVCNECGHEWKAAPSSLLNGHGCRKCAGNLKKTPEQVDAEIAEHNPDIERVGEYKGASDAFEVRCRICGHEWKTTTGQIRQGNGCPNFRKHPGWVEPKMRTQEEFLKDLHAANPLIDPLEDYKGANTKMRFVCLKEGCGYEWETKPSVIINLGGGCPKCAGLAKPTQEEFLEKLKQRNKQYARGEFVVVGEYVNSKTKIECRCHKHGTWFPQANTLLNGGGCPVYREHER